MEAAEHIPQGKWVRVRASAHWSEGLGAEIVRRTAAGESLRAICRGEGMPALQTVCRWARERDSFGAELDAARAEAGRPFRAPGVSTWCEETAAVIFDRMAAGEGLSVICRDPDMPVASTVRQWQRLHAEFKDAIDLARTLQADVFFDKGWEIAQAITPQTAFAAKVQLGHLRWHAGKLAPKRYGPHKAVDGTEAAAAGAVTNVYLRTYIYPTEEGAEAQPSGRPDQLLYSAQAGAGENGRPLVTQGPVDPGEREAQADRARADREAWAAMRAAGMDRCDGGVPTRFFPDWYREKHPQRFADAVAAERFSARCKIKARASHGLAPEAEDLIKAGWTAEAAAARHPVQGSAIASAAEDAAEGDWAGDWGDD